MDHQKLAILAVLSLAPAVSGQAIVGQELPETLGFTVAARSSPLQNLSEFDFNDLEGQVALVVYHASW